LSAAFSAPAFQGLEEITILFSRLWETPFSNSGKPELRHHKTYRPIYSGYNDQASTADEQVFPDYDQYDPGPVYD
jgi:hypothetical protein